MPCYSWYNFHRIFLSYVCTINTNTSCHKCAELVRLFERSEPHGKPDTISILSDYVHNMRIIISPWRHNLLIALSWPFYYANICMTVHPRISLVASYWKGWKTWTKWKWMVRKKITVANLLNLSFRSITICIQLNGIINYNWKHHLV